MKAPVQGEVKEEPLAEEQIQGQQVGGQRQEHQVEERRQEQPMEERRLEQETGQETEAGKERGQEQKLRSSTMR